MSPYRKINRVEKECPTSSGNSNIAIGQSEVFSSNRSSNVGIGGMKIGTAKTQKLSFWGTSPYNK